MGIGMLFLGLQFMKESMDSLMKAFDFTPYLSPPPPGDHRFGDNLQGAHLAKIGSHQQQIVGKHHLGFGGDYRLSPPTVPKAGCRFCPFQAQIRPSSLLVNRMLPGCMVSLRRRRPLQWGAPKRFPALGFHCQQGVIVRFGFNAGITHHQIADLRVTRGEA